MKNKITKLINEDIQVKKALLKGGVDTIAELAKLIQTAFASGNKLLIFGNGGSAADAIHMAAEFVGRFKKERKALPAIALSANISSLTALGNDYSFDYIFERQIEALGKPGDIALGISTSGKSKNVIRGIKKAKELKLKTAVLAGQNKTPLCESDVCICVPSENTPRIQEAHITIAHIICELVENMI
ncbi:MAG: D-sedoheptulose 7-phosphate isomerase [Candidatus Omnitrophota bacterium]|jgi:D-sedoheptulose 7-phosphate isomerase|nr:D-sedoheptulose 7-phosphate isomerase [Candidatus Omnitrophota bacterium]